MFGALLGMGAAILSSGSYIAIRKLGQAEKAPVVAMSFHTATIILSVGPVALGWPQKAAEPSLNDVGLLVAVGVTSFFAQLLLTRSLQCTAAARVSAMSFTQVIYAYILSAIAFHQGISLLSAAGVLCTLCGVALVVLRHGPRPPPAAVVRAPSAARAPSATATPTPAGALASSEAELQQEPGSLTERLLMKQVSVLGGRGGGSDGGAAAQAAESTEQQQRQEPIRAYSRNASIRALQSFKRMSADIISEGGAAAATAAAAPMALFRQLSMAASAQLSSSPSMSAADLFLAAEGACSACNAAMAASAIAYDTFGSGGEAPADADRSGSDAATAAAAFAAGAADVVGSVFAGEQQQQRLASAGGSEAASLIAARRSPGDGDDDDEEGEMSGYYTASAGSLVSGRLSSRLSARLESAEG